jgi:predicted secreted protein
MATGSVQGYNAKLAISIDGGSTYLTVAELSSYDLTSSQATMDATSHDSAGWEESLGGRKSWTLSANALFIEADQAQINARVMLENGTLCKLRVRPQTGSNKDQYIGDGFVTSWKQTAPATEPHAVAFEIKGSGALVKSAQ